jgi:MoaA/NifB/PqqE/SkfB family radical SAM enzyme
MVSYRLVAGRRNATRFRHARLYITFRCNARCGYCNVWQDPVFAGHLELDADGLRRCIDQLRSLGVTYLDVTGGEPALHRQLAVAVQHAADLGMTVEVTTNAIRFTPVMDAVVPYVATLNVSLDTLSAQRYHAIRGTDTLHRTVALVERLRADRPDVTVKLITVVTRENAADLEEVVAFAQERRMPVYLSPMFHYFADQRPTRDPDRTARSLHVVKVDGRLSPERGTDDMHATETVGAIRRLVYRPFTMVDLASLRHLETLDPGSPTICGAGTRIVTVGPGGQLLLPCYHEWDQSLGWDRSYQELVRDPEYQRVTREEVGLRPGCRRCAVYPYLGLAASYHCTREFLTQAISAELGKIKALLDAGLANRDAVVGPTQDLARLLRRIESLALGYGAGIDERYAVRAVAGVGAHSDLSTGPVAVEELLSDHAGEDCWRVQRTPHRLVRALYVHVIPALLDLARSGPEQAWALAARAPTVHLALWQVLLDLLGSRDAALPADRECAIRWCQGAAQVLASDGAGRHLTASAAVNGLGALVGVPAASLLAADGLSAAPERLLVAKYVRMLPWSRQEELADLLPRPSASGSETDGLAAPPRDMHDDELAAAAAGESQALELLCLHAAAVARAGETGRLRRLLGRWNRSVDETIGSACAQPLQDMLLAKELAVD